MGWYDRDYVLIRVIRKDVTFGYMSVKVVGIRQRIKTKSLPFRKWFLKIVDFLKK